jgi:Tectonin domain
VTFIAGFVCVVVGFCTVTATSGGFSQAASLDQAASSTPTLSVTPSNVVAGRTVSVTGSEGCVGGLLPGIGVSIVNSASSIVASGDVPLTDTGDSPWTLPLVIPWETAPGPYTVEAECDPGGVPDVPYAYAPVTLTVTAPHFSLLPGAAQDIAAGGGAVDVVGTRPNGAGYGLYHWTGTAWAGIPGAAVRIAVGSQGNPWVINSSHQIYQREGSAWVQMPGAATDIAIGADDAVWIVGTDPNGAGYGLYQWTSTGWVGVAGSAAAIAVDPDGRPWVINSSHHIYALVANHWDLLPGAATDIAIGEDPLFSNPLKGEVWVVGTNPNGAGYGIYRGDIVNLPNGGYWTVSGWGGIAGSAVAIAVDPDGNPWVINSNHQIYYS